MYQDDFGRPNWPTNGFIDDFYWHTMGFETTNLFAFWTAIAGLSAIFQRSIHIRFGDGLYPNFFILFVAPPALCRKSTALQRFDKIESLMFDSIPNEALKFMRKMPIIRGKATPEQMFASMGNKTKTLSSGDELTTDANLIIRVSELTTLLNKAQYNMTLIDKLTSFYDCQDQDTDSTITRGTTELTNIYATLWGATTPDALSASIPPEAFGGGFMSRCVIVEQEDAKRIISRPYYPPSCPDPVEMSQRLMWLMSNKTGEFTLSPEADAYYEEWYVKDITELRIRAKKGETDHRDNRKSIHVLKLALLLCAQRYDMDRYISIEDLKMAIHIIELTNKTSSETIEDISMDGQSNSTNLRVRAWIKREGADGIARIKLMQQHNLKKIVLDQAIEDLKEAKLISEARVSVEKNGWSIKTLYYYSKEI